MSPPKETIMILKVDLACCRCYKKVKKLLCSFPQIQDQVYNEKQNTVTIKVVCCSPEKIRDKLRCKGGKSIKSIEIVEPKKPAPPPEKPPEKPPAQKPPPPENPPAPAPPPAESKPPEKKKNGSKKPEAPQAPPKPTTPMPAPEPKPAPPPPKPAEPAPPPPPPIPPPEPIRWYPMYPGNVCCSDCYHGRTTGPCYQGYGVTPPPPPAGWWYSDGCGSGGYGYSYRPGYCVSRCGDYICEENPTACAIM